MEGDLGKVKQATAAVLGSQRQLEQKYNGASQVARMWYDRARLALSKGEEDLARKALEMRKIEEDKARSYKDQLDKQTAITNKLVANTKLLESKIKEAQSKKDSLKYRAEAAKATQSIQEMLGQIDTSKAIYAFEKLEEDVLRAEAKADALSDMVTSDMDAKFAALESDSAVEDDLQQLKNSMNSSRTLPAPKASESGGKSVFWKEYVDPRVEMELAEMRGQINAQY
jgi:phage shock protein A